MELSNRSNSKVTYVADCSVCFSSSDSDSDDNDLDEKEDDEPESSGITVSKQHRYWAHNDQRK